MTYKSPRCFRPNFQSIGFSVQEKKQKIEFQDGCHGGHLGFPIRKILVIVWSTSHPDASYKVLFESVGLSVPEKKRKIDFQERPSWISDQNDFSYVWSTSHPDTSYQVSSQLALRFRRRSEKYIFKMAAMEAILDFRLWRFYLFLINKSPQCFLPSLKSISLSVQEKKRKIDFQYGRLATELKRISGRKDFRYFCSISLPDASYQVSSQLAFEFRWSEE